MMNSINIIKVLPFMNNSIVKKQMMRGQSSILMHSLFLIISIFMLLIVVTSMNNIKNDYDNFSINSQINHICNIVETSIEKIYSKGNYISNDTLFGSVVLNLPDKIASSNYKISFINSDILVKTLDGKYNVTCEAGFNITYNGTSTGRTKIIFSTVNNTDVISMVKI